MDETDNAHVDCRCFRDTETATRQEFVSMGGNNFLHASILDLQFPSHLRGIFERNGNGGPFRQKATILDASTLRTGVS
jgi:hypothetical protein